MTPARTDEQYKVASEARVRIRRRLLLWSLPVILLAALLSAKTLSATAAAQQSSDRYAAGDFEGAANSARAQLFLNIFEQWKAHFNLGDAYVGLGVLDDAQQEFETALRLASGADECTVRVNLALLFELRGDNAAAAGKLDQGGQEYDAALAIIADADDGCFPPPDESESKQQDSADETDGDQSAEQKAGQTLSETDTRVQQKKDELGGSQAPAKSPDGESADPAAPSQSQLDQVKEGLVDSNKERSDDQSADRSLNSDNEFSDKPW